MTTGRSASELSMERVGQIKKALNMANWFPLIGICDQPKNSYMTACAVSPVRVLCYIPRRDGVRDEMEVVGSLSTPNYREPILALLYPQNPGSGHGFVFGIYLEEGEFLSRVPTTSICLTHSTNPKPTSMRQT